jgi:Ca-activated chloride channel homolog
MRRAAALLAAVAFGALIFLCGAQLTGHALLALGFADTAAFVFDAPEWKGAALYDAERWDAAARVFAAAPAQAYNQGCALARAGRYAEALEAFERALAENGDDEDAAFNKALIEAALAGETSPPGGGVQGVVANSRATKAGGARERPRTEGSNVGFGDGLASGKETEAGSGARGDGRAAKAGGDRSEAPDDRRGAATGSAGASDGAGRQGDPQTFVAELLREREGRVRRRLQAGGAHPTPEWLQTLPDDPGRFLKLRIAAEKARRPQAGGGPLREDD